MLLEKVENVEALINVCDIGVLFTYSEGISNSIMEYMACSKPAIASGTGGTSEIITNDVTGYLIHDEKPDEIAGLIDRLLSDKERGEVIGINARNLIESNFTVDRMGSDFAALYSEVLSDLKHQGSNHKR